MAISTRRRAPGYSQSLALLPARGASAGKTSAPAARRTSDLALAQVGLTAPLARRQLQNLGIRPL
jgi:hypothetical protein